MSNRERWVVYPLLFLTIGMAMHNQIELQGNSQEIDAKIVRCKQLEVMGTDNEARVKIATALSGEALLQAIAVDGGWVTVRFAHQADQLVLLITDVLNQHVHALFTIPSGMAHAGKSTAQANQPDTATPQRTPDDTKVERQ